MATGVPMRRTTGRLSPSKSAMEHALDRELPAFQRMFLYMPFKSQRERRGPAPLRGVVGATIAGEAGAPDVVSYAVGAQGHSRAVRPVPAEERDPWPRDDP